MKLLLSIILLLTATIRFAYPQDSKSIMQTLDSIKYAQSSADSMKVYHAVVTSSLHPDTVNKYANVLLDMAIASHDTNMIMNAYSCIAWSYYYNDDYHNAIVYYEDLLDIAEKTGALAEQGKTLYNLASTYYMCNDIGRSIPIYKKALTVYYKLNDSANIAMVYRNIAGGCSDMKMFASAQENLKLAINIDRKTCDTIAMAYDLTTLSILKLQEDDAGLYSSVITETQLDEIMAVCDTIKLFAKSATDEFNHNNIIYGYHKILASLFEKKYFLTNNRAYIDSAVEHNAMVMNYAREIDDKETYIRSLMVEADIAISDKNLAKASDICAQLRQYFSDSVWVVTNMDILWLTAKYHAAANEYKEAFECMMEYEKYRNQYFSDNSILENAEFHADMRIAEIEHRRDLEKKQHNDRIEQQEFVNHLIIAVLIVGTILLIITLRSLINNRKTVKLLNLQNSQLNQQREEIMAQRNVINAQKEASEKANLITYQSISYASHIQNAALPSDEMISRIFPEHFVYYEPKDIVSGDFYYVAQNAGLDIFVLADCTGHGVPGGFLSMLGISAIKELLKNPEIDIMPGIILDMMREYIKQALANDEEVAEAMSRGEESFSTADGMDMSIVAYDKYNHILRFAGAYQSIYIAREGDIIRLKGDRMPVGRHINESESFHTQFFNTQKGDMIYMASDGIPSQIGFSGVKFMSKRLIEFFKNNYNLPCEVQKRNITVIMDDWLFGSTQIDDLSLVGIRIVE